MDRKSQAVPDHTGIYKEAITGRTYRVYWNNYTKVWDTVEASGDMKGYIGPSLAPENWDELTKAWRWTKVD